MLESDGVGLGNGNDTSTSASCLTSRAAPIAGSGIQMLA